MRTVFKSHAEVCHMWASRSQYEGRCSNISFRGDKLYSYHWWVMAQFYETKSGKKYVFVRDHSYSSSTAKHMSYMWRAIPAGWEVIKVRGAGNYYGITGRHGDILDHERNINGMVLKMEDLQRKFKRVQRPRLVLTENNEIYETLKKYCRIFKLKVPKEAKKAFIRESDVIDHIEKKEARMAELEAARQERFQTMYSRQREEYKDDYEKWLTHEQLWIDGENVSKSAHIPGYGEDCSGYLSFSQIRLRIKNDNVETSLGAYVPVREAKILWERIKAGKNIKGFKVGAYTVIGINGVLTIGCHVITREEIERFTNKYNW